MASKLTSEFAGMTDAGRVREKNEDAIVIHEELRFVLLADGMGGYNGGEIASEMAVSGIKAILEKGLRRQRFFLFQRRADYIRNLLVEAIADVNQRIYQLSHSNPNYYGMGTTLAAAVFHGSHVTIAHVGDSRIYRYRNDELKLLTHDHTWVQGQVDIGWMSPEEARMSDHRNLLTRALGVYEVVSADIDQYDVLPNDLYLLCSDGLTDMLSEQAIVARCQTGANNLQSLCDHLMREANVAGGVDNISVVLLRFL